MFAPKFWKFHFSDVQRPEVNQRLQAVQWNKASTWKYATHGNALFLLPDAEEDATYYIKNLHDCVKKNFYRSIKFQCASAKKVASFFTGFKDRTDGFDLD